MRFVRGYSQLAAPLTDLTRKGDSRWTQEAQEVFDRIKQVMSTCPMLALLDFTQPFVLEYDASGEGDSRAPLTQDWLQESQDILKAFKENIQQAQNQQKLYANHHRIERSFEVGEMVFLRLQPYRQSSLKMSGAKKLKPQFYGQYHVLRRFGEVAYEIELPSERKIHNVFHISCLKKAIGQGTTTSSMLPPLDEEGKLVMVPVEILDKHERKLRNRVIIKYFVRWKDFPIDDAT
ncbi:uncharacterized protein LOC131070380 [Cryptomeria japonica]|uniref:uncharacterized protein LOC131070380 n=1 Tax=Cryptomeria japonica TaxID=3369 RepID=UPI0025AD14E5|nr:uncharacterized protein LOC131070380 [Cryptomeria japonica]